MNRFAVFHQLIVSFCKCKACRSRYIFGDQLFIRAFLGNIQSAARSKYNALRIRGEDKFSARQLRCNAMPLAADVNIQTAVLRICIGNIAAVADAERSHSLSDEVAYKLTVVKL